MGRKLVILDVDGTIVAGRNLPESAVDAIRKMRANGHRVIFLPEGLSSM